MTLIETDSGKIDLDKGAIQIDENWYSVSELKEKIKKLIDSDDFDISTFSKALKVLQKELDNYEMVSFKAPKNVIESIRALSEEKSKSFDSCLMTALQEYLKIEGIKVEEPSVEAKEPKEENEEVKEKEKEKEKKKEPPKPAEPEVEEEAEADVDVEFEIDEAEIEFEEVEEESFEPEEDKKKEPEEEAVDEDDNAADETTCPRCGGKVPITSTKRPLSIKCPSCGKKGRLLS
ncbi:MAG: hypothetical protein JSV49_07000 [Thermoplasmata archaeon]|nr:MAG: hypothetical protein JSV49_07000 [Thermoplasmata archaeon]